MTKWLTSLILIATLGSSVLAGMPLHSNEQECSMSGMSASMDCCAIAHTQGNTPMISAARLCCAVNCPQSGTSTPTTSLQRISPLVAVTLHPSITRILTASPILKRQPFDLEHNLLQDFQPSYIRHLALLI